MRKDRVVGAGFPRPPVRVAPGDSLHMAVFGAALGYHQVVAAIYPVQVGTFRVAATSTRPDHTRLGEKLAGINVDFALLNTPARLCCVRVGKYYARIVAAVQVDASIVVEKEGGIYS